jgi:replicative DNA helicase
VVNIELQLLATMAHTGDFTPIAQGDITLEHFQTDTGKTLFTFIDHYKDSAQAGTPYPSLSIIRARFDKIELPTPSPADTVRALAYEVQLHKLRSDVRMMSTDLEAVAQLPDPLEDLEKAAAKLKKLSEPVRKTKHLSLRMSINDIIDDYDIGNILPDGIRWPWDSLTHATKGMHRKEFYVFAGRPKSRKSFVAFEIGSRSYVDERERVLIFTPEMPPRQVMLRCIASMAKIRYTEFKNRQLDSNELERLTEIAASFGSLDGEDEEGYSFRMNSLVARFDGKPAPAFDVIQSTGRSVSWMQTQIEIFRPSIIICDSFYRQEGGKKYDSDWKAIGYVSRTLKDMTMEQNIVTIGTVQMNREAEGRIGSLSNLALSDAIGQDADAIIRVITGKIEGEDRSALVILGGREVPFDGLLINNRPCYDFTEIGPITSRQQVMKLMEKDDEAAEKEEGNGGGGAGVKRKPRPSAGTVSSAHADAFKAVNGGLGDVQLPEETDGE